MPSPNMLLPIPGVGSTNGPQYATDVNSCLTLVDSHDHSIGSGVKVTPNGLNINSALAINNQVLSSVGVLNLYPQLTTPTNISLYANGSDLWFVDGAFNAVRITIDGGLAGTPGSIGGLVAPAAVTYSGGTFVFQSNSAGPTAANIDAASYIFRNSSAGSFGVTLQPVNALASDYTLTLPPIPTQTNVMTLDISGNMDSITYAQLASNLGTSGADDIAAAMSATGANAIGSTMTATGANAVAASRTRSTGTSVGTGGVGSRSVGIASSNVTYVISSDVTITTSGRPVRICMMAARIAGNTLSSITVAQSRYQIFRDGVSLTGILVQSVTFPTAAVGIGWDLPFNAEYIDFVPAGTYSYTIGISAGSTTRSCAMSGTLIAYEL